MNPCANCQSLEHVSEVVLYSLPFINGIRPSYIRCSQCKQQTPISEKSWALRQWNIQNPILNPCTKCGASATFNVSQYQARRSEGYAVCTACDNVSLLTEWNSTNPLPEVDEVAELESKLAECYELLDGIVNTSIAGVDIRILAADLLKKHRGN